MTERMNILHRVNAGLFLCVLVTGGVLFSTVEHDEVSEGEKRVLAKMPEMTWQALGDRQFFRKIDDFVADHFIFRNALTELAGEIRAFRGWLNDDVQIFTNGHRNSAQPSQSAQDDTTPQSVTPEPDPVISEGPMAEGDAAVALQPESAVEIDRSGVAQPAENNAPDLIGSAPASPPQDLAAEADTALVTQQADGATQAHQTRNDNHDRADQTTPEPVTTPVPDTNHAAVKLQTATPPAQSDKFLAKVNPTNDPYQVIEAVIVFRGRALQIMGGTPSMAQPMIQTVNRYQQELGPDVTVYFMAAPIGSDFYLPEKVNRGVMREKILIDSIHARLNPAVRPVLAYDHLAEHVDDYLYFNTDHHWTGLGAYYAYTAFAKAAGFTPLALLSLPKNEISQFLGTLYYRTMSPALKAKGDKVEYFKIPNRTEVTVFNSGWRTGYSGQLYVESARGGNAYSVFLGGDAPLMRIRSDVRNNRKIAVIKDSYGNAFVPYLAAHYQEVYVIDYRSFKGNIKSLIRDQGIQDVLFAHNTFVVASGYAAQQALLFLNNPNQQ